MRISDSMAAGQVNDNVGKNRSEMSNLQNQAATQKRVNKPSDDPVSAARVLGARIDKRGNDQYQKNLNYARSFMDLTDQALGEVSEQLMRVKELALSQANDASANDTSRRAVATEVQQIFEQMVAIGNRKLGDRYIFGGYKTTTRPFDMRGQFAGDNNEMLVHIDKDNFIAMNLPGSKVFLGEGLSGDKISHSTSTQATTVNQLQNQLQQKENAKQEKQEQHTMRAPASDMDRDPHTPNNAIDNQGRNVFVVLKDLTVALNSNDKEGVQETLTDIDDALEQVVLARSQVGARSSTLQGAMQSLQQENVDIQGTISQLEDADIFKVVSDINKTEGTLQATLQTAGKMLPKSLLDFVR